MSILSRAVFREIAKAALLGVALFTFVFFLQRLNANNGVIFALLVKSAAPPQTIAYMLGLLAPPTLPFTVPVGVLVGILIALSRMSTDNEVTAMRAAGVPARALLWPVVTVGALGLLAAAAASLWLTPWSLRETIRIARSLSATQLTSDVQPRVFEEDFPNTVLYVGDVIPGPVPRWRKVFMADLRPPDQRRGGAKEPGEAPPVTIAQEAIPLADPEHNRIQLSLRNGFTHEIGKEPTEDYNSFFPRGDQALEAQKPSEVRVRAYSEIDTVPLEKLTRTLPAREAIDPRIELHQRLALPWGCLLLAMVGVPVGVSSRKGGRSAAFVFTVALAFLYYMGLIAVIGLARQGTLSVPVAVWTPNALFAIAGLILLSRMEMASRVDLFASARRIVAQWATRFRALPTSFSDSPLLRLKLLPQVLDTYVLSNFLFYFAVLLASFVLMVEVFTFFELLSDIVKNKIAIPRVLTYLLFLTPKLLYDSAPIAVLVAVLVTFGIMTKNNEVTAFKASGVSTYRMATPILLASLALSALLFAFDHYYIPEANRRQDAIRAEIKGRPVQTYLRPDRKWTLSKGSRVFYYRYFDFNDNVMSGVSVYDLDFSSFQLRRLITAERARWEPNLKTWVFQNGQVRTFKGIRVEDFRDFRGQASTFTDVDERPGYFRQEVKLSQQMNFLELGAYIQELSASGFDTTRLQVQRQSKFSVPLFVFIMALISIPFAFLTGSRGAMAGVGVSLGIAIAYWSVGKLFEQIGYLNQLPPSVAAWAPDVLFGLAGMYLLARMRT